MDLYAKLSSNMEELAGTFDARMQEYESNLKKMSSSDTPPAPHKELAALSREFTDFKSLMWKTLSTMRLQLELVVQGLDRQETNMRRKVLLFHGIAESNDSSVEGSIISVLHNKFEMRSISSEHFAVCHRLGSNTTKPRPVMVRFASYKTRCEVWNAKTSLKSSGITVSEFLTKSRHEVFAAARKHYGIRKCWTSEGKIVIVLPDNKRRRIESMSEFRSLLLEHPITQVITENLPPGASQAKEKTSTVPVTRSGNIGKAEPRSKRVPK